MLEPIIPDRIIFSKAGDQRKFIVAVKNNLDCTWDALAKKCSVCSRTLRGWRNEYYRMPYKTASTISKISNTKLTSTKKLVWTDHVRKAGKVGGDARLEKYGKVTLDEKHREKKWREWWNNTGKYELHPIINQPLPVKKPRLSQELAEFVGIVLGDGGISDYQITITMHRYDDKKYIQFVRALIKKIFDINPGIGHEKNALADYIFISRIQLVEYFTQELGLHKGDKVKQQVDIPQWIKKNQKYYIACVRGLVDTDGSVFTHKYVVNGKEYSYKKMSFSNSSIPLLNSVTDLLSRLEIKSRQTKKEVRIDGQDDVQKYINLIGFDNPKHLKRYQQ